ncbi:hypothetical protein [Bradyrhizobium canariense]|uniref:hypothetical protein n=1 Tax=Bradyrhizobium canariense TaxID=255045 RepID=UPI000B8F35DB|nr:hypothetical protein [Bradyrhizobium canariense]
MSKITAEHPARQAVLYMRRSADQVASNLESERVNMDLQIGRGSAAGAMSPSSMTVLAALAMALRGPASRSCCLPSHEGVAPLSISRRRAALGEVSVIDDGKA